MMKINITSNMDEIDFVSDEVIYFLSKKYPDILSFYKDSSVWQRVPAKYGWKAPQGTADYFDTRRLAKGG